jgi:hypothetical protein
MLHADAIEEVEYALEGKWPAGIGTILIQHEGTSPVFQCGYGGCSSCSCPGFYGSGSTCSRSGCGHHYDSHW